MPRLIVKSWHEYQEDYYSDDITRMRQICHRKGFETTRADVTEAWAHHSERVCAGWLVLPEDDEELFLELLEEMETEVDDDTIKPYTEEDQILAIAKKEE